MAYQTASDYASTFVNLYICAGPSKKGQIYVLSYFENNTYISV